MELLLGTQAIISIQQDSHNRHSYEYEMMTRVQYEYSSSLHVILSANNASVLHSDTEQSGVHLARTQQGCCGLPLPITGQHLPRRR